MTTFLTVPFAEKDQAKNLGARWNAERKKWYVPTGVDLAPFKKWGAVGATGATEVQATAAAVTANRDGSSKKLSMEEIGLTLTGDQYVARSHECVPWLPCDLCDLPRSI